MFQHERINEILDILNENRYVSVEYLSAKLHISPSSIRRDLSIMEDRGLVRRSYGGVELIVSSNMTVPYMMRMQENKREKKRIAISVAKMIKEGDVLFVDASTTVQYLLQEITNTRGITIITNSVQALHYLSTYQIKVISTGGTISYENRSVLTGDTVMRTLDTIRANFALFSAQGLDNDGTFYDCYQDEIDITRKMIERADCRVLLCDSNKLGKTSTFVKGTLNDVDYVACDISLINCFSEKFPNLKYLSNNTEERT